jgi:hypothetical protein
MTAPFFLRQQGVRASPQDPHDSTIDTALELTHVDVLWIRQRVENRVRFGRIEPQHVIDRQWRCRVIRAIQHLRRTFLAGRGSRKCAGHRSRRRRTRLLAAQPLVRR